MTLAAPPSTIHLRIYKHTANLHQPHKLKILKTLHTRCRRRCHSIFSSSAPSTFSTSRSSRAEMVNVLKLLQSQSKLSHQEISDLQKATHFDKKELQQWYKGGFALFASLSLLLSRWTSVRSGLCLFHCGQAPYLPPSLPCAWLTLSSHIIRLPQRLSHRPTHEIRIPKDLPTILPLWRSDLLRRIRVQRLRQRQVRQYRLQRVHMCPECHESWADGG